MDEYWESRFKSEGAMWKFEPSDSALIALGVFIKKGIQKILIPGVGYGRNAKPFFDAGFDVNGIEISASAIKIAKENGLDFMIHHGSVTQMPFDNQLYEGIFSYALIHLLNKNERRNFLRNCFSQLASGGIMVSMVVSDIADMFGRGRYVSTNRYEVMPGIKVYFYNNAAIEREFGPFGLLEYKDIAEPVKFAEGYEPLQCKFVVCKKI
jgi:SAM-dependent methyltransferase